MWRNVYCRYPWRVDSPGISNQAHFNMDLSCIGACCRHRRWDFGVSIGLRLDWMAGHRRNSYSSLSFY